MNYQYFLSKKANIVAQFREESLANSSESLPQRLHKNIPVLCMTCGDLASMVMIRQISWDASSLRRNTLLVLAVTAFEDVATDLHKSSAKASISQLQLINNLNDLFDWMVVGANPRDDVRNAMVLTHALSCVLKSETFTHDCGDMVHTDLLSLWQIFQIGDGKEEIMNAFAIWKQKQYLRNE